MFSSFCGWGFRFRGSVQVIFEKCFYGNYLVFFILKVVVVMFVGISLMQCFCVICWFGFFYLFCIYISVFRKCLVLDGSVRGFRFLRFFEGLYLRRRERCILGICQFSLDFFFFQKEVYRLGFFCMYQQGKVILI